MKTEYNYNKIEWLQEMFPDGEVPKMMATEVFEELKAQHKEIVKQRIIENERINQLKQQEYAQLQIVKDKIKYSDQLANEICERVSAGELLINITEEPHMPTLKRAKQWLKQNSDFAALFDNAIQDRLSIYEEEVVKIADDATLDFKEVTIKNQKKRVLDPEVISRAKLRIDVRFRHLKAGRPAKWGDQSTLITKDGDNEDPTLLSNEELERRIQDLETKDQIFKSVK